MYFQPVPNLQQSTGLAGIAGFNAGKLADGLDANLAAESGQGGQPVGWRLEGRQALSFRAPQTGVLRVVRGRVWATADGPHSGPPNDWGDVVLNSGDTWPLPAGQRLVIEPWAAQQGDPAWLSWEPAE